MKKIATKTHTNTSRSGISIERIVQMNNDNVDHDVIALQMTKNSSIRFTAKDILSYIKLHEVTKTKSPITKKQTNALIKDQKEYGNARKELKIA